MTDVMTYAPGTFCWSELATNDAESAKRFYGAVFGWTANDVPIGPDMNYTMLHLRGREVAALYQVGPQEQGAPPHWNSYVAVVSADETAERAKLLGGTVLAGPFDVMDAGRMAIIQDPQGAMVSVWQANKHGGAGIAYEPNTMCWFECGTTDATAGAEFYAQLFGWNADAMQEPFPYTVFKNGDAMAAGMMELTKDMPNVPPHWLIYFAAANCDATAALVAEHGGQTIVPPTDIPDIGRFAVLADPQGAIFALLQPNQP